ncbi:hypothetical protein EAH78_12085 [Pseudomonas arsenicoxydans]|uniref:Uncharacterized protein n=1 Tax=Pseudomonas arsenicoxydans TaxID=702115 RepID=A0A502HYZ5_9PSED|nr:hypothetical protein EAH78_12085 [Pseudomonas arsenicoxydans]
MLALGCEAAPKTLASSKICASAAHWSGSKLPRHHVRVSQLRTSRPFCWSLTTRTLQASATVLSPPARRQTR